MEREHAGPQQRPHEDPQGPETQASHAQESAASVQMQETAQASSAQEEKGRQALIAENARRAEVAGNLPVGGVRVLMSELRRLQGELESARTSARLEGARAMQEAAVEAAREHHPDPDGLRYSNEVGRRVDWITESIRALDPAVVGKWK